MSRETDRAALSPRAWIYWADMDWVAARVLYRKKNLRLWPPAGLLGHKALEQYLKTYLRSHGSQKRWERRSGHDLTRLAKSSERFDDYFKKPKIQHRLRVFWEIYQSWEYPGAVPKLQINAQSTREDISAFAAQMETSFMAGDNLSILDELVAEIRPRINFPKLDDYKGNVLIYFPSQFSRFHGHLKDGKALVRMARIDNPAFGRMEREAKKRHPPPRPIGMPKGRRKNP